MTIGKTLATIRKTQNITQEDMARQLYVTRQAVSRWENGETSPSIDMCKLIAVTFDVPITQVLEMPQEDFCQSCGMPFYGKSENHGTQSGGMLSEYFCSICYRDGAFIDNVPLEDFVEHAAPFMAQACHITPDEAVSYLSATLPQLKRWNQQDQ